MSQQARPAGAQAPAPRESTSRRDGEKKDTAEMYSPLDPKLLVSGIESVSNNVFGFFQQTFTIPFQNLPKFFDDREVLKSHIFRLDGEMKGLQQQLVLAEHALEATKAERARSAADTMRHWRQHRREVEKLKEDQAELLTGLQELRAQSDAKEMDHATELSRVREALSAAKREAVELRIQLAEAQSTLADSQAQVTTLQKQVERLGGVVEKAEENGSPRANGEQLD